MVDFVKLHRAAAQFLETKESGRVVYTAWPLTGALRNPAFGYVEKSLPVAKTSDLRYSTLRALIHLQWTCWSSIRELGNRAGTCSVGS